MKIGSKSIEVLKKLYKELIDSNQPSLTVSIDVKQFVENCSMTNHELGRCLCYLYSAGYINCTQPSYISEEKKTISLTALAIDLVEQSI